MLRLPVFVCVLSYILIFISTKKIAMYDNYQASTSNGDTLTPDLPTQSFDLSLDTRPDSTSSQAENESFDKKANENTSPVHSANTITETCIQNLHEYCLLDIFSVKSLNVMDLCSLAETCQQFRHVAQRTIPTSLHFVTRGEAENQHVEIDGTKSDIERLFKNFGSRLTRVTISNSSESTAQKENVVLNTMTKSSRVRLKTLTISWFTIPDVLTIKLKPIFKRLLKLVLRDVSIQGDAKLFNKFDSLVDLVLRRVENCDAILQNIFPKLTHFRYGKNKIAMADASSGETGNNSIQNVKTLSTFIAHHQSLKTLFVSFCCDSICSTRIIQAIGDNCKKLMELAVWIRSDTVDSFLQPLQTLESLQVLHLRNMSIQDLNVLSPLSQLSELHLRRCILPQDSKQFSSLAQLRTLEMHCCRNLDIVDVISRMINLKEFTISETSDISSLVVDERKYSTILAIVRGRPNVLRLKFRGKFGDNQNLKIIEFAD